MSAGDINMARTVEAEVEAIQAEVQRVKRQCAERADVRTPLTAGPDAFGSALELLASADARAAHLWLVRHRDAVDQYPHGRGLQKVPSDVLALSHHIAAWRPIDRWHSAPAAVRRTYSRRVAALARDLAEALAEEVRPEVPAACDLFDSEVIEDAMDADPACRPIPLVIATVGGLSRAGGLARIYPGWRKQLSRQQLVPMLSRLAKHVESKELVRLSDARPKTGNANHRSFARHLSDWFERSYGEVPNGIVADLVNLMLPSLDSTATDVSVREWRGMK